MEIALTGEMVTAERLETYGLINRLCEPGEALQVATELARIIAANAPMGVSASKRVVIRQRDWSTETMFEQQESITRPVLDSEDAREGARAFKEKRNPNWSGK